MNIKEPREQQQFDCTVGNCEMVHEIIFIFSLLNIDPVAKCDQCETIQNIEEKNPTKRLNISIYIYR